MAGNHPKNVKKSIGNLEKDNMIRSNTAVNFTPDSERDILVPSPEDVGRDPVLTFILIDKSKSMRDIKDDVIIAHRLMINALRDSAKTRHKAHFISQHLFATTCNQLGPAVPLAANEGEDEVILLDDKNYIPDGETTDLYRSVYRILQEAMTIIESFCDEGFSPKLLIAVITDGVDNVDGCDPDIIRSFLQEMRTKDILQGSNIVGLKGSKGLDDEKLEEIRLKLGFDDKIACDKSDSQEIRKAFRMASQSLLARLR